MRRPANARRKPGRAERAVPAAAANHTAAPVCPCGACQDDDALRRTHAVWLATMASLSESGGRMYAALKAVELGDGGVEQVAQVTRLSPDTIRAAVEEMRAGRVAALPAGPAAARPTAARSRVDLNEFQDWHEYEQRLNRPMMMKLPEFQRDDRLRHVIFSQQFDRPLLERIGQVTTKMREMGESREGLQFLSELLRYKRAMLYFTQASTRTFMSFMAACQVLGMTCNEVRDPSVSSEAKGESPLDSIRMFSSYFDVIIMRAPFPHFAEACAYLMNDQDRLRDADRQGLRGVPIINGGSGADEHPTQALLDVYTLQRIFSFESRRDSSRRRRFDDVRRKHKGLTKGLDGKTYCFCGDIGRGRTVRSLATLLALYENVTMVFVYPPHPKLQLSADLREYLLEKKVKVEERHRLSEVVRDVDVLYMTRIQHEHDQGDQYDADAIRACQLTTDLVAEMREYAAILHPFPRNGRDPEIPFEIDDDPRAMYFEQSNNGLWVRAALLGYLFNVDGKVYSEHEKMFARRHDYNLGVL